jgi:acetyl esterase/lipase
MIALRTMLLLTLASACPAATPWQPLWPGVAPGGQKSASLTESEGEGGRLTDIRQPEYQLFLPPPSRRTGAAVVILPGGGYSILAMSHEGVDYAKSLAERGIVAVLVKYRVSGRDEAGYGFPVPLMDARRAIRLTRSKAKEWGVDASKVGVMGSSAGGHLASMCATLWDEKLAEETTDEVDAFACRPDFAVLVYPVISMADSWGHSGSRRRLLGPAPDAAMTERVSTHLRVNGRTPPCFLVHAADDGGVPLRNSMEFAARCAENHVPVVCHVFARGGHGFGMKGRGDSAAWPELLFKWLVDLKLALPPQS